MKVCTFYEMVLIKNLLSLFFVYYLGYSIFVTVGELPDCEADQVLRVIPAVQEVKPQLLLPAKSGNTSLEASNSNSYNDNEEIQLQKALQLSLGGMRSSCMLAKKNSYSALKYISSTAPIFWRPWFLSRPQN